MTTSKSLRFSLPVERPAALADQVRKAIISALEHGQLHPGDKLVIEEIAADLGVSRTPVREALQGLAAQGLIEIVAHRRAILKRISPRELSDAYDLRALLEGYATELAAVRKTTEDTTRLRESCSELEKAMDEYEAGDTSAEHLREVNRQFHSLILQASGNSAIPRTVTSLWNLPHAYGVFYWESRERQQLALDFHLRIAEAIAARRPSAARDFMRQHIQKSKECILEWLRADNTQL